MTYHDYDHFENEDQLLDEIVRNMREESLAMDVDEDVEPSEERSKQTADKTNDQRHDQSQEVHLDRLHLLYTAVKERSKVTVGGAAVCGHSLRRYVKPQEHSAT